MTIKRSIDVEITPAPFELAAAWWAMGADEQAEFFNTIDTLAGDKLRFQLQSISDSTALERSGRGVMIAIGEYGPPF